MFGADMKKNASLVMVVCIDVSGHVSKEAQARTPSSESKGSNEAVVDRFRSARFGMTEKAALKPIFNDFKIPKSKIQRRLHPTEKTVSFNILVNDLLPNSGKVNLFYFF